MNYKTQHRVLVFGGRDFIDKALLNKSLDDLDSFLGPFSLIQGGARGADALAKAWAMAKGAPCVQVDAPWNFYGNRAGPIRNQWMLEVCHPTYAVAFAGGSGTADMIRRVQSAGITLWMPL